MRRTVFKEKSSIFLIGKGFIIAAIVAISSLSLTLGYFVGKSSTKVKSDVKPFQSPVPVASTQQVQQVAPASANQVPETTSEKTQGEVGATDSQQSQKPKKIIYTVQVSAFKDSSEAEALRERLDKKGYKPYVTLSETKNERLYKVRIGEFSTRRDAEALSVKIKKAEGLPTFVTFKTE
ncbi:MAG: SPOR domain-containing protein [Nitrospirota bacterium]